MHNLADATDLRIIEALRPDPRITNKQIAERLNLAETTVSQRIKSMNERNVMRVVAQRHVFSDGIETMHFFFINTIGRTVQEISADIVELDGVVSASQGIGNPDIFVNIRTKNLAEAHELARKIGDIEGIATLESAPCFKIHKMDSRFADLNARATLPTGTNPKEDAVVHAFMQDGRQSNREVARNLSLSEGTIRQRLNKALDTGHIQFQVVTNPAALDLTTVALIRITTLTQNTRDVINKLTKLEAAHFVAEVAGTHNIIALTTTKDALTLGNLCDNELMPTPGVHALDVQMLVATTQHQYLLAYFEKEKI